MGESIADRCAMLVELGGSSIPTRRASPSTPWCRVAGTPLAALPPIDPMELVRNDRHRADPVPRARCASPRAGRALREAQLLAMYAGANSIFYGTGC